ncbi:MAG: hypothetical protein WC648_05370, partial [Candidatus Paceibacterota bacterium]
MIIDLDIAHPTHHPHASLATLQNAGANSRVAAIQIPRQIGSRYTSRRSNRDSKRSDSTKSLSIAFPLNQRNAVLDYFCFYIGGIGSIG